jgi:hypothetical protein
MADAEQKPRRVRAGELVLNAERIRATAAVNPSDPLNGYDRRRANELIERVSAEPPEKMTEMGAGGELAPVTGETAWLYNTVTRPNYVTVDASRDRLELANKAGVLELGLDVAETIRAENSLEKMLAHQLAALHQLAMKMTAQINDMTSSNVNAGQYQANNVERCRLANTVSRMQSTFQQGLLTLQRIRSGGVQVVTVQHVQVTQVADGGKAIVAGKVITKGRGRQRKGDGQEK